jgi:hypothetical protein
MGQVRITGGPEVFEIEPAVTLDKKTADQLEGIPATVLMEAIRQRLLRHPENRNIPKAAVSLQMKI